MENGLFQPKRHWKDIELWKDVPEEKWNDWIWQLTNTIGTLDDFEKSRQSYERGRRRGENLHKDDPFKYYAVLRFTDGSG
jgi:L-lysine 2,3-aminomutase